MILLPETNIKWTHSLTKSRAQCLSQSSINRPRVPSLMLCQRSFTNDYLVSGIQPYTRRCSKKVKVIQERKKMNHLICCDSLVEMATIFQRRGNLNQVHFRPGLPGTHLPLPLLPIPSSHCTARQVRRDDSSRLLNHGHYASLINCACASRPSHA